MLDVVEAVPVVRLVFLHRKEVPCRDRENCVEVVNKLGPRGVPDRAAVPVPQPGNVIVASRSTPKGPKEGHEGIRPLPLDHEVHAFLVHRAAGKRRGMQAADGHR